MRNCPKCNGAMTVGAAFTNYEGYRLPIKWVDGEVKKSFWLGLSLQGKTPVAIIGNRCTKCGLIELYSDPSARTGDANIQLAQEHEQLKQQVTQLLDRISMLERIATDPAERTAREIESLRALPPAKGDPSKS